MEEAQENICVQQRYSSEDMHCFFTERKAVNLKLDNKTMTLSNAT